MDRSKSRRSRRGRATERDDARTLSGQVPAGPKRELEVADVIRRHLRLEAARVTTCGRDACVVDQHVRRTTRRQETLSKGIDRRRVHEISDSSSTRSCRAKPRPLCRVNAPAR
jgi:hypothetical protein